MAQRSAVGGEVERSGIVEVEHLWVPMPDGVRLAARLWRPAVPVPVPAIVEAIPYGKRWGTRWRDEGMHPGFARRGFAVLRLDVRGTGDSEGTIDDEYTAREQADLDAAIAWLAAQPWCSGRVTVLGKSWGGFAALQAAARRPSQLAAAVAVCASDDRYGLDAHYMGGCLLVENAIWGASFLTLAVEPPDPALVGPGWREMWHRRLAAVRPFAATWLQHPWRDAYWRHGSVADRPEAVACPVLVVGGWTDAYTDAVPRLLATLPAARGIVGPWAHRYPHNGVPGPPIDFVELVAGWLDRRLGPAGGGAGPPAADAEEPLYRLWMPEPRPPGDFLARWPGRWVAEEAWPSPRIETRRWRLAGERLVAGGSEGTANGATNGGGESRPRVEESRAGSGRARGGGALLADSSRVHRSPQSVGAAAGTWCPFGYHGDLPLGQADDDRRSLAWESDPLAERLELLGAVEIELRLAVDRPRALLAARLVDVAPDGSASRVSYGLLNLAHRDGHERPRPMPPGEIVAIRLPLRHAAWAVPAGHRLRLALSTTYWPIAWPSPEPVTLTVTAGELALPVRPPRQEDAALAPPAPWPEPEEPEADPERDPAAFGSERDEQTGELRRWWRHGFSADGTPEMEKLAAIDLELGHALGERDCIRDDDPLSAEIEVEHHMHLRRGDWQVRIETRTRMTATAEQFRLETRLRAHEGERLAAERSWDQRIPRRLG